MKKEEEEGRRRGEEAEEGGSIFCQEQAQVIGPLLTPRSCGPCHWTVASCKGRADGAHLYFGKLPWSAHQQKEFSECTVERGADAAHQAQPHCSSPWCCLRELHGKARSSQTVSALDRHLDISQEKPPPTLRWS